jgi:hypothetical protein
MEYLAYLTIADVLLAQAGLIVVSGRMFKLGSYALNQHRSKRLNQQYKHSSS